MSEISDDELRRKIDRMQSQMEFRGGVSSNDAATLSLLLELQRRRAETRQEPTDYSNLLSVITEIRERSGVGSKPMLSELADAIAGRIAEPKVGDEIQFCPQCGWNSAMDATPEPLPAGAVTDGLVAAVQNLLAHWDRHDGPEKRGEYAGVGYWSPAGRMVDTQVIADLRAAFAARPAEPVAVEVKPLEWKGPDENTAYGEHGGFVYTVMSPNRTPGWRVWANVKSLSDMVGSVGGVIVTVKAESREAAFAAAQADYEQRSRPALLSAPAPGLVEALRAARPIVEGLINAEYNVETWGLRQRLSAIDAALSSITETGGAK